MIGLEAADAVGDELRDPLDDLVARAHAARGDELHGGLRPRVDATEDRPFLDGEVHLGRRHPFHRSDGALEFSLERAPMVDALREVGHPPGGLVEELEPGAPGRRQRLARERDACTRRVGGLHQDLGAPLLQPVLDARLGQLVAEHTAGLDRHAVEERHPLGARRPAGDAEDHRRDAHADRDDRRIARPADATEEALHLARHGSVVRGQDCIVTSVR
ncbi:MAG: hypothetical protein MUE41_08810 [Gemmatimonadaceae bacterium]|nr:hypothetical protein [Gemmatimonadaceae bacterium]